MIAARKEADIKYQAFLDNDKVDVNFAKLEYVYIQQIGESPDLLYSIDLITRFTFTAFDTLMAYKEGQ